jgi:hypothetical protein
MTPFFRLARRNILRLSLERTRRSMSNWIETPSSSMIGLKTGNLDGMKTSRVNLHSLLKGRMPGKILVIFYLVSIHCPQVPF